MNENLKVLLALLLVVIVGSALYLYYGKTQSVESPIVQKPASSENMNVVKLDAAVSPPGLPTNLPIEKANLIENTELNYPDRGVVLYSIVYRSSKQMEELYSIYQKYLTAANGYKVTSTSKTAQLMSFAATKDASSITVVITPDIRNSNLVKIAFLYHKS